LDPIHKDLLKHPILLVHHDAYDLRGKLFTAATIANGDTAALARFHPNFCSESTGAYPFGDAIYRSKYPSLHRADIEVKTVSPTRLPSGKTYIWRAMISSLESNCDAFVFALPLLKDMPAIPMILRALSSGYGVGESFDDIITSLGLQVHGAEGKYYCPVPGCARMQANKKKGCKPMALDNQGRIFFPAEANLQCHLSRSQDADHQAWCKHVMEPHAVSPQFPLPLAEHIKNERRWAIFDALSSDDDDSDSSDDDAAAAGPLHPVSTSMILEQVVPKKARALMILLKRTDLMNTTLFKSPLVIGGKAKEMCLFTDRNIVLRLSKLLAAGVAIADTEDDDSCRKFVCELDAISALAPTISTTDSTSWDTLPADCLSGMQFRKNCWCKTDERVETTLIQDLLEHPILLVHNGAYDLRGKLFTAATIANGDTAALARFHPNFCSESTGAYPFGDAIYRAKYPSLHRADIEVKTVSPSYNCKMYDWTAKISSLESNCDAFVFALPVMKDMPAIPMILRALSSGYGVGESFDNIITSLGLQVHGSEGKYYCPVPGCKPSRVQTGLLAGHLPSFDRQGRIFFDSELCCRHHLCKTQDADHQAWSKHVMEPHAVTPQFPLPLAEHIKNERYWAIFDALSSDDDDSDGSDDDAEIVPTSAPVTDDPTPVVAPVPV
jgi:hypothetical protein